jgi:hypothetical protein
MGPTAIGSTTEPGPSLRLLFCHECQSVDEIPPFIGRPEDDVALERLIYDLHTNNLTGAHHGLLYTVPVSAWVNEKAKREIIKQIRQGGSGGLDAEPDTTASRVPVTAKFCSNSLMKQPLKRDGALAAQ